MNPEHFSFQKAVIQNVIGVVFTLKEGPFEMIGQRWMKELSDTKFTSVLLVCLFQVSVSCNLDTICILLPWRDFSFSTLFSYIVIWAHCSDALSNVTSSHAMSVQSEDEKGWEHNNQWNLVLIQISMTWMVPICAAQRHGWYERNKDHVFNYISLKRDSMEQFFIVLCWILLDVL